MSLTPAPQIQQAPRSGIIQKLKQQQQSEKTYTIDNSDKQKTIRTSHNSDQQYLSSSESSPITASTIGQKVVGGVIGDDDGTLKQVTAFTNNNTASMMGSSNDGSNHNSVKSSPSITVALHSVDVNENKSNSNSNGFSTTSPVEKQEIAEDEDEYTTESSDSIEYSDYNSWFHGLYDSNIHDVYWDGIYNMSPLLGDALCQLDIKVGSILVCLGDYKIEKTNSTEKAEEFVDMIFDNIESVKSQEEIEELNKKYVPQFNIEHNDGMNLYDLYRMYHCDLPLLKAKSIIPYYPDDESFEKKLLYKMLPEAMKKGVIDSLEKHFYGIFELPARARIGKIRNSIKQNKELDNLKEALYEYISREGNVLE